MNADRLVWWLRHWLNSRVSHRHICVHLRSFAVKIPSFLITQPQPDATRRGPGPAQPRPATPGPTAAFKPSGIDPLNHEPPAKSPTVPFKPSRIDPMNREPVAKPGSTAPRAAASNTSGAAATALPARAHDPAPRPGQSGEGSKVRPAPAEAGGSALTLLPSPGCPGLAKPSYAQDSVIRSARHCRARATMEAATTSGWA
jgi:hypothetical protein